MKHRTVKYLVVVCSTVLLFGCGSDTSSFSILPDGNTFQQSTESVNTKIDVLWVVDNSGSMRTSQEDLAANFQSFIENFETKGYDFQMSVATTDAYLADAKFQSFYDYDGYNGDYSDKYYDNFPREDKAKFRDGIPGNYTGEYILSHLSTPLSTLFQTNILQGTKGWGYERPFESMVETLNHPFNQGLLRADSFFAVIIVTDEDDFSVGGFHETDNTWTSDNTHDDLDSVQSYIDYLDTLTESSGASRRYNVNNISILDEDCRNALNDEFNERIVAERVHALTAATEGFQGSLCADFGSELSQLADKIIMLSSQFYLDRLPIADSITVVVDGKSIQRVFLNEDGFIVDASGSTGAQGWYFNEESNSVVFTAGAVPAQGAAISVNFDPAELEL